MKLLITGGKGMLGSMLAAEAEKKGHEVFAFGHEDMDITKKRSINKAIKTTKPDVIINCAAYTNVDQAQKEVARSNAINGYAPGILGRIAKDKNILFIHISTDMVFSDENHDGYTEDDDPGTKQPNQYGKSKALGEREVLKNNPEAYIIRTSWVFGPNGKNFVDTMLKLSEIRNELIIVDDEIGVPTYTKDISEQILHIIEHKDSLKPGIYHAVSEGKCSRFEEAESIFAIAGKEMKLNPISQEKYGRETKIPKYIVLINTKLPKLQNWEEAIKEYIQSK